MRRPLFVIFLRIQKLYLLTSREIKRIEGVNKSPVYALFSVTLPGLACIRAGRLEDHFRTLFVGSLDRFHRPHYLFLGGSRWVGIRLDALSNALVLTVACTVVWLRGDISPALAGVVPTPFNISEKYPDMNNTNVSKTSPGVYTNIARSRF